MSNTENKEYCNHLKKFRINRYLKYCQNCGIFTFNQLTHNNNKIKKNLIKPNSYKKSFDFNPLEILHNNKEENSLKFPRIYEKIRNNQISILFALFRKLHSSNETLYLSIYIMDKVFSTYHSKNIETTKKRNLITISSFILAFKYREIDNYKSRIDYSYFIQKFNVHYKEIVKYELKCLKRIDYNFNVFDIYTYLHVILFCGFIFENEISSIVIGQIYNDVYKLLEEKILDCYLVQNFNNKQIAFSLISLIRDKYNLNENTFRKDILINIYNYHYHHLSNSIKYLKKNNKFNTILQTENNNENDLIEDIQKTKTILKIESSRNRKNIFLSPIHKEEVLSHDVIISKTIEKPKKKEKINLFKSLNNKNMDKLMLSPISIKENESNHNLKIILDNNRYNSLMNENNEKTDFQKYNLLLNLNKSEKINKKKHFIFDTKPSHFQNIKTMNLIPKNSDKNNGNYNLKLYFNNKNKEFLNNKIFETDEKIIFQKKFDLIDKLESLRLMKNNLNTRKKKLVLPKINPNFS
jgi:hypothetical protein